MKPGTHLAGRKVLVVGLARSGMAAAEYALAAGAKVTATDVKTAEELGPAAANLAERGVRLEVGTHGGLAFEDAELVVVSPGVPSNLPGIMRARERGVPVWGEVELAWRAMRGRMIGITGSNGKTTTTALTGHVLKAAGIPTLIGGNIGTPLISLAAESTDATVTVAEISSFQLETIDAFHPDVAALLNLTPDHIDRHGSFEEYARMKLRMFENQTETDIAILNADDAEVAKRAPARSETWWFSREKRVAEGTSVHDGQIVFRREGEESPILRVEEIPLRGAHNVENVLAASAAACLVGADPAAVSAGVRSFAGVEHRLEFVREAGGVEYFNDSKATNVDATRKALEAFSGNVIVILGGKDKGSDYRALSQLLRQRARLALLIGAAAEKIASQIEGAVALEFAGTLDRAVEIAAERARSGDTVLLAPACASFDQFDNFEHRGRVFRERVMALPAGVPGAAATKR
ncbi:MAG: UDP-N-acetylmuramoyl-L-alanine--D-glutamate ligase [Candidatus Acidiferrales bacterium]